MTLPIKAISISDLANGVQREERDLTDDASFDP